MGLCCCAGFSLVVASGGCSSAAGATLQLQGLLFSCRGCSSAAGATLQLQGLLFGCRGCSSAAGATLQLQGLLFGCRGCSSAAACGFLTAVASLVAEQRLKGPRTSVVVAHGLSCSLACGVLLDQGLNPFVPHWQVDSLPASHQGSPQ